MNYTSLLPGSYQSEIVKPPENRRLPVEALALQDMSGNPPFRFMSDGDQSLKPIKTCEVETTAHVT